MKSLRYFTILSIAVLSVLSCSQDIVGNIDDGQTPSDGRIFKEVVLTATAADAATGTKTTRDADGGFLWSPGDEINLFYGPTEGCGSKFVSQNSEPVATATFLGIIEILTGTIDDSADLLYWWGTYPFHQSNTCAGNSVNIVLPDSQVAVENSWGEGALASVGKSPGLAMSFYNVVGGIRFYLTEPGIERITLQGNNGETVAGEVTVEMVNDRPSISAFHDDLESITLYPPVNSTQFQASDVSQGDTTWYFITIPPVNFTDGFTLTLLKGSQQATKTYSSRAIERNKILKYKNAVNDGATWSVVRPANNQIYYTTYNGESIDFHPDGIHHTSNDNIASTWDVENDCWVMTFPSELNYLDDSAFSYEYNLKTIILPESLTDIGKSAFLASDVNEVYLGSNTKYIHKNAFFWCRELADIELPEGLLVICEGAFTVTALTSLHLPSSLLSVGNVEDENGISQDIGANPFSADNLASFSGKFATDDGKFLVNGNYTRDGGYLIAAALGAFDINTPCQIPDGVTTIGEGACQDLIARYVFLPQGLRTIRDVGFAGIQTDNAIVTIPATVTDIGEASFRDASIAGLVFEGDVLPTLDEDALGDSDDTFPVYITSDALESLYAIGDYWGNWGIIWDENRLFSYEPGYPSNNQLWYTTTDNQPVTFHPDGVHHTQQQVSGNQITSAWDAANERWVMTFPDELTYLDDCAFWDAMYLKTITLPDCLETIGQSAFQSNAFLTDVHLGTSTAVIRNKAFNMCNSLSNINLPEGLQYICYDAFRLCTKLESITLPSTLLGIGVSETSNGVDGVPVAGTHDYSPFAFCNSLTAFYGNGDNFSTTSDHKYLLSENGTFLIAGAKGALNGGSVNIPNDVTVIGDNALRSIGVALMNLGNNITTIGRYALADARYLIVTIGPQVTNIKENAFSQTTTSNWIEISGDILPTIESGAFGESAKIHITGYAAATDNSLNSGYWSQYVEAGRVIPFQDNDEIWYHKSDDMSTGLINQSYFSSLNFGSETSPVVIEGTDFLIPDRFGTAGVSSSVKIPFNITSNTAIGVLLFDGQVTSVPQAAFEGMSIIDFVSLPYGITTIGVNAFKNSGLTCFPLANNGYNLTSIGHYAFYGLSQMTFPKGLTMSGTLQLQSLTSLGIGAFEGCTSFGAIDGSAKSTLSLGLIQEIPTKAFYGCESLTHILIRNPGSDSAQAADAVNSITTVSLEAFRGCSNLVQINSFALKNDISVNLPSLTSIGDRAFYECSSITDVTLGAVQTISGAAFSSCPSLESVTLISPQTLTTLGGICFYGCTSLVKVGGSGVTSGAFLPNVTTVSAQAFDTCTSLETITLPAVVSVGNGAFTRNRSLTTLKLGPDLTSIGNNLFYDDDVNNRNYGQLNLYMYTTNSAFWDEVVSYDLFIQWFRYNLLAEPGHPENTYTPDYFKFYKIFVPADQENAVRTCYQNIFFDIDLHGDSGFYPITDTIND